MWDDKKLQWVLSNDFIAYTGGIDIHTYRKLDDVDISKLEIIGNKMEKDLGHVKNEPDAYYER